MVLVATETDGRLRLAHALTNDEETLKAFADANLAADASVTSDGHAGYNATSLSERTHEAIVQTNAERAVSDTLQRAHWSVSMLKRWLIGTHAGAIKARHLQAYLDEFAFRWICCKTNGVGRISARTIEMLVSHPARTMRAIVDGARPYPLPPAREMRLGERERTPARPPHHPGQRQDTGGGEVGRSAHIKKPLRRSVTPPQTPSLPRRREPTQASEWNAMTNAERRRNGARC